MGNEVIWNYSIIWCKFKLHNFPCIHYIFTNFMLKSCTMEVETYTALLTYKGKWDVTSLS